jgi:hypothetical protein
MVETAAAGWTEIEEDALETRLAPEPGATLLLGSGASAKFGRTPTSDVRLGGLRVRIGRKPAIHNLRTLYKRRGRGVPEEYDVFWSH